MNFDHIIAIGAHVDDIECGAAGFLHKIISSKAFKALHVVYFTPPDNVVGDPKFEDEYKKAMRSWGFRFDESRFYMHYMKVPVRRFNEHRQSILQFLYELDRDIVPDLVLVPSTKEVHQDHLCVTHEAIRTFRDCSLLGYEMPMVSLPVENTLYVELSKNDVQAKLDACAAYKSQSHRASINRDAIAALAKLRGNQAGMEFAEAFEVLRWVIR